MHFADPGLQYVLKSKEMFEQIRFLKAIPVNGAEYFPKRRKRDETAREKYRRMLEEESEDGLYLSMLMNREKNSARIRYWKDCINLHQQGKGFLMLIWRMSLA
jgi:hypothetical protein